MEMQNDTQTDIIVNDELVKKKMGRPRIHPEKLEKEKTSSLYLEDRKAYFRQYYHKHTKRPVACPTCGDIFVCQTSYNKHAKCNRDCIILNLHQQLTKNNEDLDVIQASVKHIIGK